MNRVASALNAEITGSGSEHLVLAHGFGADKSVWDAFVPMLARHYRVVRYDLACAGTAGPSAFDLRRHESLSGYVEDLEALLGELGIRRCTFVGHSMSGMIGVLAALKHPSAFERLILIGASPRYIDEPGYVGGFGDAAMVAMLDAISADFAQWAKHFVPVAVARPPDDPATRTFLGTMRRMRPDIALATWQMILKSDHRRDLAGCRVPAVILQTKNDPAVPLAAAEFLHAELKGSVMEILDVDGHLP